MWKKDEEGTETPRPQATAATATSARAPAAPSHARTPDMAAIGPSITIRGEVTGDEDLLIKGAVEGSVDLGQHSVEVGREGRVKANITGRIVTVEGEVEGDLEAEEQIILRPSAQVKGDLTAPRVVLEDGAKFRGMVDMGATGDSKGSRASDRSGAASGSGATSSAAARTSSPESGKASSSSSDAGSSKSSAGSGKGSEKDEPKKVSSAAS